MFELVAKHYYLEVAVSAVIANLVLTLDGHISGPAGPHDMSCIAPHGVTAQARDQLVRMTDASVVLLGRANYEGFMGYWPAVASDPDADPRDRHFATWLNAVDKVVFSRTLTHLEWENSRLALGDPADVVAQLRDVSVGDIRVLSSISIIRQLLETDQIDALEITLAPTIVGGGDVLFKDGMASSEWTMLQAQPTDSGAVRLDYQRKGTETER